MSGSRRLVGGLPRAPADHRSGTGTKLGRPYSALVVEFGEPAPRSLRALELSLAALALLHFASATRAWRGAQHDCGAGRERWSIVGLVSRLARRAALEEASATSMLDRLRHLEPIRSTADDITARVPATNGARAPRP